jgi:nucleotide-binding universal stress UspA family protein
VTAGDPARGSRPDVLDGPFTTRQLMRLDRALRVADTSTGLIFSVYVGELDEPTRGCAEKLHGQLANPVLAVLVAVSPNQRCLEIVTGGEASRRVPDRACRLAALSMVAAFGGGDLTGGIVGGLAQLAGQAGNH